MNIYFITIANKITVELEILQKSAKINNINLIVLGLHKNIEIGHHYGFGWKLILLRNFLRELNYNDIFIFMDAFDVVILSNVHEILKKFFIFKCKILFSAENYCWPDSNKETLYKIKTKFHNYLNSGTFMAYVGYFKKFYDIHSFLIDIKTDDQRYYTDLYLQYQDKINFITLDRKSKIFMCLAGAEDLLVFDKFKNRFKNKQTNQYPCIIHSNGKNKSFINYFDKNFMETIIIEPFAYKKKFYNFYLIIIILLMVIILIYINPIFH